MFEIKNEMDNLTIGTNNLELDSDENENQNLLENDFLLNLDDKGNFKFKKDNFKKEFFKLLNQFRLDESFCDINIKIENKVIKAHRIVIATIPYFYHMFSSNMKENLTNEVEIKENISYLTFQKVIDYAYTGKFI
jgi:hypothetical protein